MFDVGDRKKNQLAKANETTTTIIGQGIFIEGQTFRGIGTVRIDGVYLGEMFVDGHVIIGQSGEIRGNITANTMTIAGTVTGNIICKEELHITETAMVEGDLQTNIILVDQGAGINGSLSTGRKTLAEPINLDDALKNINSGRKVIDMSEDDKDFAYPSRKTVNPVEDKIGFFSR